MAVEGKNAPNAEVIAGAKVVCTGSSGETITLVVPASGVKGVVAEYGDIILSTYNKSDCFKPKSFPTCAFSPNNKCVINAAIDWDVVGKRNVDISSAAFISECIEKYQVKIDAMYETMIVVKNAAIENRNQMLTSSLIDWGNSNKNAIKEINEYFEEKKIDVTFTSYEDAGDDWKIVANAIAFYFDKGEIDKKSKLYIDAKELIDEGYDAWHDLQSSVRVYETSSKRLDYRVNKPVLMKSKLPCWSGGLVSVAENSENTSPTGVPNIDKIKILIDKIYDADMPTSSYKYATSQPTDANILKALAMDGRFGEIIELISHDYATMVYFVVIEKGKTILGTTSEYPMIKAADIAKTESMRLSVIELFKLLDPPAKIKNLEGIDIGYGFSDSSWQNKLIWNIDDGVYLEQVGESYYDEKSKNIFNSDKINKNLGYNNIKSPASQKYLFGQMSGESGCGRVVVEKNPSASNLEGGDDYRGAGYLQVSNKGGYAFFADYCLENNIITSAQAEAIKDGDTTRAPYQVLSQDFAWEASCWWWEHSNPQYCNKYIEDNPNAKVTDVIRKVKGSTETDQVMIMKKEYYTSLLEGVFDIET